MDLQEARGQSRAEQKMQAGGHPCPDIESRAALANWEQNATGSPRVLRVLAADQREEMIQQLAHGYLMAEAGGDTGSGIGTFVTGHLGLLRSTKNRAQSSGEESSC